MNFQEKLELIQSAIKLAKFWDKEVNELFGFLAIIDKDKTKEWNKIAKDVSAFSKMDIEGRAKKLGLTVKIINKNKKEKY